VHRSRRLLVPLAAGTALACAVGLSASGSASADDDGRDLLRSGLVGSTPSPQGPTLFGVAPGGAPWVVDHTSSVRVRDDGRVDVKVRGLVIPERGNPVARVVATVVCNGGAVGSTVTTQPADLSPEGDGRIRAELDLPDPCLAPAVLVRVFTAAGVAGPYIAANGG
jgi:hypothetical protein